MTLALALCALVPVTAGARQVVRVALEYHEPGTGPSPNFSPKGTQVPLADVPADVVLPAASIRPARTGLIRIGPGSQSYVPVMVTADAEHPKDLCRLFLDRNRNGSFADDGPPLVATPSIREKTGDAWSSFSRIELTVPYASRSEPYMINVWIVRQGDEAPNILRYSVGSWRSGSVTIGGVEALVAAMDANNDAVFDGSDMWSVLEADAPDAAKRVLSIDEARGTDRLMFIRTGEKDLVLEFRGFSPDGRTIEFAVVDRPVTKSQDRAGDDTLADERPRPRAGSPFEWETTLEAAQRRAKAGGKHVIVDFWTSWCGPCRMMDEWIWTDAEVVSVLREGFVGVKLDGDIEKALVQRFGVKGYPTMLVLDGSGKEVSRADGYLGSKQVLELLARR
jgi:thiol-disulfide isomerase/thioredoxin